ncbi:unnamed protein product [Cercopithifilaria johnstoni]|uniref:Uncharacterized protein n=1 Tax=Cercopithifilaria johnstoni TaxID=2874296 RepID=A0A8J2MHS1_9BILA|nr:unnamed protein product [Cercopithifilaria johnstoni]
MPMRWIYIACHYPYPEHYPYECYKSYLTPVAFRNNTLSSCKKTGANTGSSGDSNGSSSSERFCTVSTKQHYHNNVTTSITIPYDISHSKQSSAIVLQNAQKKVDKVVVEAASFKQKKDLIKGSHPFMMTQPTDCSQSSCLSQNLLPPIHETLPSFRQPSSLLNETTVSGSHRYRLQNQMTSTVEKRLPDSFERNQQQRLTTHLPVTSKNTTVMQDVCSGGGSDAINSDTMYTQQQITMVSSADCMYNRRRQQLATAERSNSMNAYDQGSHIVFILASSKQWNSFLILSIPYEYA